jgi:hypothetical protein
VRIKKPRESRRVETSQGIPIVAIRVDRAQQIIEDPERYFEEARSRAQELVERDMRLARRRATDS